MREEKIKYHFNNEAKEFDDIIQKIIPNYCAMVEILTSSIPFPKDRNFSMIDLGCGTGTLSYAIKNSFPNVDITCVDIASEMLEIAKNKLGSETTYIQADLNTFEFSNKYDLIVSSLALHHLESDSDKLNFYKKVYSALEDEGIFINLDVVLGSSKYLQDLYIEKWKEFMRKNLPEEEIYNRWLKNYYIEDRPAMLITHMDMLKESGFDNIDVLYKLYNFAIYSAKRI